MFLGLCASPELQPSLVLTLGVARRRASGVGVACPSVSEPLKGWPRANRSSWQGPDVYLVQVSLERTECNAIYILAGLL